MKNLDWKGASEVMLAMLGWGAGLFIAIGKLMLVALPIIVIVALIIKSFM